MSVAQLRLILLVVLFLFSLFGSVNHFNVAYAIPTTVQWLTQDFATSEVSSDWQSSTRNFLDESDARKACEAHLANAICLTDEGISSMTENWDAIECDRVNENGTGSAAGSEVYLSLAMQLYDEMPERIRPLFCSIERLFLSDNIPSVAFASVLTKDGSAVGAIVGARKATFFRSPSSASLMTWKEQLIYGGSQEFLANDPDLVQISYDLQLEHLETDGLYYVIMHELGHIVDFQNQFTRQKNHTIWNDFSWTKSKLPKSDARYSFQDQICYYQCTKKLSPALAEDLYTSLSQSGFITTYAGQHPMEDFAEFWAWHAVNQAKKPQYMIRIPGGPEFNFSTLMESQPKFKMKLHRIRNLWESSQTRIGFDDKGLDNGSEFLQN